MTMMGETTGIACVDITSIEVCRSKRIWKLKVFQGLAKRGKTSMGWFFGFKLHLIVNDQGELLTFSLTPGNVDDREPVPALVERGIMRLLFGDRDYISSELAEKLRAKGVQLMNKLLQRKRGVIETIIDQLKNISEHSRHRSPVNFIVNLLGGLIPYCHQPKKPSIHLSKNQHKQLMIC